MAIRGNDDLAGSQDDHPAVISSIASSCRRGVNRFALVVLVLGLLVALTQAVTSGEGASGSGETNPAVERTLMAGLIEEAQGPGPIKADPAVEVSEVGMLRDRIERIGGRNAIGSEVTRAAKPRDCPALARGAVVDVGAMLPDCGPAAALAADYRSGLGADQTRNIDGFTCSPVPDLQVSCARTPDAATVILLFGPGGRTLDDCGRSPIGEAARLSRVRADGMECNEARKRISVAVAAGTPTEVDGLSCSRVPVSDVETVSCEGGGEALAFTMPTGS